VKPSRQLYTSAALAHGKRTPIQMEQEVGWALGQVWIFLRTEKFLSPGRFRSPDRPAISLVSFNTMQLAYVFQCAHQIQCENVLNFPPERITVFRHM